MTFPVLKRLLPPLDATTNVAPTMFIVRIGLCLVAMWAIFGIIVFETRREAKADAKRFGADVATLVETAIARQFEVYDLSVRALAVDSTDEAILALPDALKRKAMFDQSAEATNLAGSSCSTETVGVIEASRGDGAIGLDFSDRDYFRAQVETDAGLFVGGPFIGRFTHLPSMAISRRRPSSDGRFVGVAVGSIQLSFFELLFTSIHLPGSTARSP